MDLDALFKIIVEYFTTDLASWLLGQKVVKAEAISGEFTRKYGRMDSLLKIELANGTKRWLHIEFQGKSSKPSMPVRILNYIALLMDREDNLNLPLDVIVVYAGKGSGKNDNGQHNLGEPRFGFFNYKVIRLWDITSEVFLENESLGLLPLLGQSKMENPEAAIQAAFKKIKQENLSVKEQSRIISVMAALMAKKEWLAIMERLAYDNGLKMETPFVIKIRNEGMQLGRMQGREEGREEGLEEGLEKGRRQERELMTLDFLNQRYDLDNATIVLLREHFASLDMAALSTFCHTLMHVKNKRELKRLLKTL